MPHDNITDTKSSSCERDKSAELYRNFVEKGVLSTTALVLFSTSLVREKIVRKRRLIQENEIEIK